LRAYCGYLYLFYQAWRLMEIERGKLGLYLFTT
jgi:hypothetical protein